MRGEGLGASANFNLETSNHSIILDSSILLFMYSSIHVFSHSVSQAHPQFLSAAKYQAQRADSALRRVKPCDNQNTSPLRSARPKGPIQHYAGCSPANHTSPRFEVPGPKGRFSPRQGKALR